MSIAPDMLFEFGGAPVGRPVEETPRYQLNRSGVYFVDGLNGSDSNDGKTREGAFATIATGVSAINDAISWSATPWATSEVLYIAPGVYAENLTALPYGGTVVGLGDAFDLNGQRGVTIKPASGSPFDATSVINCRLRNVCFESPDTSVIFQADNFNRNIFVDVLFSGLPGASPTTTRGFEVVKDMTGSILRRCIIQVARNGIYINTDNANSKQASGNIIEYCRVRGADQKGIYFDINSVPSYTTIDHCTVGDNGTTLALGLDDDTDLVTVSNTNFWATANDPATGGTYYNNCYLNGALIT